MNNKTSWLIPKIVLLGLYAAGIYLWVTGNTHHLAVWIAGLTVIAHMLEIPVAFKVLKPLNPDPLRTVIGTVLFGFTYWLPAKRGIYTVR